MDFFPLFVCGIVLVCGVDLFPFLSVSVHGGFVPLFVCSCADKHVLLCD